MKIYHYLLAAATMLAGASCSDGLVQEPLPEGGVAIKATIERVESRASIESGKILWSKNDKISVLLSNNKYATLKVNDSDAGKASGTFTGVIFGDGVTIHDTPHAYYPAELAGDATTVTVPATHELGDDLDNSHAYMKAELDGGNLSFVHLGGVLKFKMNNVPAGSAEVIYTTLDKKNITGEFALETVDGKEQITAAAGDGTKSSVSVKFDAMTEDSNIEICVPMPVGSYQGIKLEIKDAEGNNTVDPVEVEEAANTIERAVMVTMPSLTFVSITGGGAVELDGKVTCGEEVYETIAQAVAANPTATDIELHNGSYALPSGLKNLTITGVAGKSVVDWASVPSGYDNVTIKNVTFNMSGDSYQGFQHATTINFDNCVFNGLMFGYGQLETYTNCTFNQETREYHMWTYGANSVYDGCTFNGAGKFLHLYNEGPTTSTLNVEVKNCHFKNNGTKADKAAIVVKSAISTCFNLTITNCTTEGLMPTTYDENGLWQVDEANPSRLSITVDGNKVYPSVSLEADGSYTINNAAGVLEMQKLFNSTTKAIVFNFKAGAVYDMAGLTYANSEDGYSGAHPKAHITINGNGAVIKNLTVTGLQATLIPWTASGFSINDLTIKDSSFTSTNANDEYCVAAAFGAFCDYTGVSINGCTLDNVTVGGGKYVGGLVAYCSGNSTFSNCTVKNSTISSSFTKDGVKYQGHAGGLIGRGHGAMSNCSVINTTFNILGDRGGIFVGTVDSSVFSGTGSAIGNTGLSQNVGTDWESQFTATVTE